MSAVRSLRRALVGETELVWIGVEGDESSCLIARATRHEQGLIVEVPAHARLVSAAVAGGRALLMTSAGDVWLERPCSACVVAEASDTATVQLIPAGPPMRVEVVPGAVPKT